MPVPFLVPVIGSLVGTAAAPALGISTALAAGIGGGIATLAAGGSPGEALLSGITGGIGGALVPGIAGAAGKGAAAAASKAGTETATKMAADTVAREATRAAATAPTQIPQVVNEAGFKINPEKAFEFSAKMLGGQEQQRVQGATPAPSMGPLRMSLGDGQQSSGTVMDSFTSGLQAGDLQTPAPAPQPGVQPVMSNSRDIEMKRIPLQMDRMGYANGGLASLAANEMARRGMNTLPNLGDREQAFMMARREFARGGYIEGPGTGTSDDIDAVIYQNGVPVEEAMLSDGEFVMTEKAVKGAGNGDRNKGAAKMYQMMQQFEERAA